MFTKVFDLNKKPKIEKKEITRDKPKKGRPKKVKNEQTNDAKSKN